MKRLTGIIHLKEAAHLMEAVIILHMTAAILLLGMDMIRMILIILQMITMEMERLMIRNSRMQ